MVSSVLVFVLVLSRWVLKLGVLVLVLTVEVLNPNLELLHYNSVCIVLSVISVLEMAVFNFIASVLSKCWHVNVLIADDSLYQHRYTVRDFVTKHLNINGIPRRYFWELMSVFSDDDLEREKLQEFCTASGQVRSPNHCECVDESSKHSLLSVDVDVCVYVGLQLWC